MAVDIQRALALLAGSGCYSLFECFGVLRIIGAVATAEKTDFKAVFLQRGKQFVLRFSGSGPPCFDTVVPGLFCAAAKLVAVAGKTPVRLQHYQLKTVG